MTDLLTAAQMRAIEQAAIDSGEVSGLELMERAGQAVVEAIFEQWPALAERGASPSRSPGYFQPEEDGLRAVVLCGPGNNGGDGFVVARLLKESGWAVEVYLYGDADKLPPDAQANCARWGGMNKCKLLTNDVINDLAAQCSNVTVCVDALFGAGLNRPCPMFRTLARAINAVRAKHGKGGHPPYIVCIDVPTGLDADSGRYLGDSDQSQLAATLSADLTVTFHLPKIGHHCGVGPLACGVVQVRDIGLFNVPLKLPPEASRASKMLDGYSYDILGKARPGKEHKYSHGHALVLSGPATKTGAARLAARGALRTGAGVVTIGGSGDALLEHAAQVTAIMLWEIDSAAVLADKLKDDRITSLCLGPGMGVTAATRKHVEISLETNRKTVLDADALTVFQDDPDQLFTLLHEKVVLTPHGGEFARLFPDIAAKLNAAPISGPAFSKVDASREAAARAGCVVLFKGPDTVIAAPDGWCSINSAHYQRSAPWLATAGSGDVLAGFITGLMARGFAPMEAAETGAWLHVECALKFGPGLIAEDITEQLPAVFRDLAS